MGGDQQKINMYSYTFDSISTVIIVLGALAAAQSAFQLGISVLTLLSGHSLGRQRSLQRLLGLNLAYITGMFTMLMLLFGALLYMMLVIMYDIEPYAWMIFVAAATVVGLVTMTSYYRHGASGTMLWLPRPAAKYLADRAKQTTNAFEAMVLGGVSALAELPFTIVPMAGAAYVMMLYVVPSDHFVVSSVYCLIVVAPLVCITVLLSGGHRLSTIQRWRETNKWFLQYAAAAALFAIALLVAVSYMMGGAS